MPIPHDEAAPAAIPNHTAHPGHKLKRMADDDGELFICAGCKEPGFGARYICDHEQERCNDFAMHTCCAVAPATVTYPAFGAGREFLFLLEPEPPRAGTAARSCAECREDVLGFVYHCFADDIDLHPCCARRMPEHAVLIRNDGRALSLGKEVPASRLKELVIVPEEGCVSAPLGKEAAPVASRPRETSDDDDSRSPNFHWPSTARHRWLVGRQASKRDPPPEENTQPMNNDRGFEVSRQEVSRLGDAPVNRNRGREGAPASRYRWSIWRR